MIEDVISTWIPVVPKSSDAPQPLQSEVFDTIRIGPSAAPHESSVDDNNVGKIDNRGSKL
eukprot:scaffold3827_cov191-Ochromonas_danica.AAC.6